jgi:glycosyltransferase involved in cell wall biosynthesis
LSVNILEAKGRSTPELYKQLLINNLECKVIKISRVGYLFDLLRIFGLLLGKRGILLNIHLRILKYKLLMKINTGTFIANGIFECFISGNIKNRLLIVHGNMSNELYNKHKLSKKSLNKIHEIEKKAFQKANTIICVDNSLVDYVKEISGNDTKCVVIPNSIDTNLFYRDIINFRKGKKSDYPRKVLYVSNMNKEKYPLFIAKVFIEVFKKYSNIEFLIVGNGLLREDMEKLLINIPCTFFDAVPNDLMGTSYRIADIVCQASNIEAYSRVTLESLACGTPVIVTPKMCIEPLKDNVNCIVAPFNIKEYCNTVIDTLNRLDEGSMNNIIEQGLITIKKNFLVDQMIKKFRVLYET